MIKTYFPHDWDLQEFHITAPKYYFIIYYALERLKKKKGWTKIIVQGKFPQDWYYCELKEIFERFQFIDKKWNKKKKIELKIFKVVCRMVRII